MRKVTEYDFGYTDEYKWLGSSYTPDKIAFKRALKLTENQIEKFKKLDTLIGYEVDFTIGKKVYNATIVAVTLPDSIITAYPSGEISEYYNKEFAQIYCAYPFYFNLAIDNRMNFWSHKIDNINIESAKKVGVFIHSEDIPTPHIKFKDHKTVSNIYK